MSDANNRDCFKHHMRWLAIVLTLVCQLGALAQSTITHFSGSSFRVPFSDSHKLDVNFDGKDDFIFGNGGMLCTADVPTSACATYYVAAPLNGSALFRNGQTLLLVVGGSVIGPSDDVFWSSSEHAKTL